MLLDENVQMRLRVEKVAIQKEIGSRVQWCKEQAYVIRVLFSHLRLKFDQWNRIDETDGRSNPTELQNIYQIMAKANTTAVSPSKRQPVYQNPFCELT